MHLVSLMLCKHICGSVNLQLIRAIFNDFHHIFSNLKIKIEEKFQEIFKNSKFAYIEELDISLYSSSLLNTLNPPVVQHMEYQAMLEHPGLS